MDVSGYKFQSVAVNVSGQTTKVAVRSVTIEMGKGPSGFLYKGYNMAAMDKPFESRERNNELAVSKH